MEEFIRVINENGVTKIYYKPEGEKQEVWMYELKNGEAVRISISSKGKLASINEKRV